MAKKVITGTLAALNAVSAWQTFKDAFEMALWGAFTATVALEKSYDGGVTAIPVSKDSSGAAATFAAPCSVTITEPEVGVVYRVKCTAFTSAPNYRLSGYDN